MPGYVRSKRYRELFKKPGSRRWWCFLPNPAGGKALRESTGQDDELAAHRWYLERVRSRTTAPDKDEASLLDALTRRLEDRAAVGRAAGPLDCHTKKGRQLVRVLGPGLPVSAIDARTVDAYIATRLREGVQRTTVHKELETLRGALKLARRQGYAVRPLEEVMPVDFSPKYKPRDRALSLEEIDRLLAALKDKPQRRALVAFLLATGATYPSEVARLRKGDIDTAKHVVHLRGTKRETRDRRVPVVSFARKWLLEAVPYAPFERWTNVRRDLHAACAEAGIAHCSPNDLRRSIATLMRARGIEPQLIGAYLGHADSRMAERIYGRITPDQLGHLLEVRLRATGSKKNIRTA